MLFSDNTNLLTVLSIILFGSLPNVTTFASDDATRLEKVSQDVYPVVVLDKETQQISGLQIMETQPGNYQPEFAVFGKAVNIQPLLTLRHRYLQALAYSNSAKAKFTQSEQGIKRIRDLYDHGIAAKRRLQEQQSQWQADKSQADAAFFQIQAIADEARLNWGNPIAEWIMTDDSNLLIPFLSGQQALLQITLPSNRQLADGVQSAFVDPFGNRGQAQAAGLISLAPKADNMVQGNSYFFQTPGKKVRAGMNITAWIPEKEGVAMGVIVPKSAVIWSMDQSFVYIKTGEEQFSRRMIKPIALAADGYFINESIKPGEYVVTTGGQMLWSEELRGQIPGDDD